MYATNNLDSTYCCTTAPEQAWVEQYQTATLALFATLPSWVVIYSSACFVHCLSSNADFYEFTVDGVSLMSAMSAWYFSDTPSNTIESCTGWQCTLQCSGGPWQPSNTPCASTTNVCANTYMYSTPPAPAGGAPQQALPPTPAVQAPVVVAAAAAAPAAATGGAAAAAPTAAAAASPPLTAAQQAQAHAIAQQAQLQAQQAADQAQTLAQQAAQQALVAAQSAAALAPPAAAGPAAAVAAATERVIALSPVAAPGPAPGPTSLMVPVAEPLKPAAKTAGRFSVTDVALLASCVVPIAGVLAWRATRPTRIGGKATESSSLL
jgi:hypothetical protein